MQVAASTQLRSIFGYGSDGSVRTVTPVNSATTVRSGGSWTLEDQAFGAALIRESRRPQEPATYGPDARLRGSSQSSEGEENAADSRTTHALERREQEVRHKVEERGEAVGGTPFVYQSGPGGKMYAVGTAPHVVRKEGEEENGADSAMDGDDSPGELSASDRALQQRLEARDALVRGHEAAHMTAAGPQARGPAQYTYQAGPDGKNYAIGGSVNISIVSSPMNDEDAARQAQTAARAAGAVGDMSLADAQVATRAGEISAQARNRAHDAYTRQAGYGTNPSAVASFGDAAGY